MILKRLVYVLCWLAIAGLANGTELSSPDGRIRSEFVVGPAGELRYSVQVHGAAVVEPSRLGVTLDGVDLGEGVALGEPIYGEIDEARPMMGGHRTAQFRARTMTLPATHRATGRAFFVEARASDDGIAWRIRVPGTGSRTVNGEATAWTLPTGSKVWFFERDNAWKLKTHAGVWKSCDVDALPEISARGPVQGLPLLVDLPSGGYALLSEAALFNYSGLRLRAEGDRRLRADFTEGKKGFVLDGEALTPWRVTVCAQDLDALVNSDFIASLNPAPDPKLFGDSSWIKPGRAVWRWWSRGTGTPAEERDMVDAAAALGFEYSLVDDGWKDWPGAWAEIEDLVGYADERDVGIFVWKDYNEISDPVGNWAQLRAFLDRTAATGAKGVKLDFLNAESKDRIDFITTALRLAAERRLLVAFHGIGKPTGGMRTYPNELTREGVRGLELNKMAEGPITPAHNAALPFTRFAVGAADYTPLGYSEPGRTTWAHQLATVVQFTSPLQVIAEHPEMLLSNPETQAGLDVLKAIPAVWDATHVLPPSAVGEVSVMARRKGETWFLSALNGDSPRLLESVDLSFLGPGAFQAVELTSPERRRLERREIASISDGDALRFDLAAGDGAVVMFSPSEREVVSLEGEWSFALDPLDRGADLGWSESELEGRWDKVSVPHDFLSDPRYEYTGVAWYRKSVQVPADQDGERRWRLSFDTVFQRCRVWVNGRFVGAHEGGYTPFAFDVTEMLESGEENLIAVAVDNRVRLWSLPGARTGDRPQDAVYPWLNYGGILGAARLESSDALRIARQKIETVLLDDGRAEVSVAIDLRNEGVRTREAAVEVRIGRDDGSATLLELTGEARVEGNSEQKLALRGTAPAGAWTAWSLESPALYRSVAAVKDGDRNVAEFGFRSIGEENGRLLVNGRPVQLAGANRAKGSSRSGGIDTQEVIAQDLGLMKAAGLVFARLQHTAPGEELLEWADRNGMLLILEVGVWGNPAEDLGTEELQEAFRSEMREMMEMAWNHPSVVGWSLGNEYESWTPEGVAWTRDMAAFVRSLDDTRPVTFAAIGKALRELRETSAETREAHAFDFVDLISTNIYFPVDKVAAFLDPVHERWPDKPVFISEFGMRSESKSESQRIEYVDAMFDYVAERPWICGLAWWSFNDYASRFPGSGADGYRRWGLVDEYRTPRALYHHIAEKSLPEAAVESSTAH